MMRQHKFFILLISSLVFAAILANFVIDRRTVFLGGEFLFSFDYGGHLKNLLTNYLLNKNEFFYQTQCRECPIFYQLSSWYALWSLAARGASQLLGFHPFVFYLLATIAVQFFFLYLFVKLVFRKFYKFSFIVASTVFIFFPHKIYLVPSATWDGVIYGLMVGVIGFAIYVLREIASLKPRQLLICAITLGVLVSFFLNLAISHFPIIFYSFAGVNLWFLPKILKSKNLRKLVIVNLLVIGISTLVNLPLVISQFFSGNVHILTGFITFNWLNALTAGATFVKGSIPLTVVFFIGVFILLFFSKITIKQKIILVLAYLGVSWLLLGLPVGNFKLYQFIFSHFPFMEHMRSLYRFSFFQLLIMFIIVYFGLVNLTNSQKLPLGITGFSTAGFLVFWLFYSLFLNFDILTIVKIPNEYFETNSYLDSIQGKKIYFPAYGPPGDETMSGNYNWLNQTSTNPTLYTNPFTSLFFINDLVFTEGYQLDNPQEGQLRSLVDYREKPADIVNFLEFASIDYLIIDGNYLWKDNFPDFQIDKLTRNLALDKQIGQIYIYKLENKSSKCRPSYGDFAVGYCYDKDNPEFLINKTPRDYFLDKLVLENSPYLIERNGNVRVPDLIVGPEIRNKIIEQKILIPFTVYQADNSVNDIYVQRLEAGVYKLYFPILKLSAVDRLFRNTQVLIKLDGQVIHRVSPYSVYQGIFWQEVNITVTEPSTLSIGTQGQGAAVFGTPLLVKDSQIAEIESGISNYSHLPMTSTYGQADSLRVRIDGIDIPSSEKYFSSVEADLLSERFTQKPEFQQDFQKYDNHQDTNQAFTTKDDRTTLVYTVAADNRIEELEFIVGSAFLDSENLGKLKLLNLQGKTIFESTIFQKDKYLATVTVPPELLSRFDNNFKVQLEIDKTGVLFYRFVLRAKFAE